MTRKDYFLLADCLKQIVGIEEIPDSFWKSLMNFLKKDNPNFSEKKFLDYLHEME